MDTIIPALYFSHEQIVVSKDNLIGYIGPLFIIGIFDARMVE
jgi:hypothetical protein